MTTQAYLEENKELVNFYRFFPVKEPENLGLDWYNVAKSLDLRGTILVASEGVNLALCGKPENIDTFLVQRAAKHIKLQPELLRRCTIKRQTYRKLRLKIKPEIIHSRFELKSEYKPSTESYINPEDFHKMAQKDEVTLLDVRNEYETIIGSFKNALCLPLDEFHKLPQHITKIEPYRHKLLLTFCTGGVRCEKAVLLLEQKGFQVKQLYGGILHYLEKYGKQAKHLWQGECFVFDDRVAVNAKLQTGSYMWCEHCGQPSRGGVCVVCDG